MRHNRGQDLIEMTNNPGRQERKNDETPISNQVFVATLLSAPATRFWSSVIRVSFVIWHSRLGRSKQTKRTPPAAADCRFP